MSNSKQFDGKSEVKLADAVLEISDDKDIKVDDIEDKQKVAWNNGVHVGSHEKKGHDDCCHDQWVCDDVLGETEFPCDCDPVKSGLTDIVDSVAHQENGFAKILESESKKICKAIGIARSIDDLIKVDKSVQDTIKQINNVQIVLLSKLQEVSDICDGCADDCGCK